MMSKIFIYYVKCTIICTHVHKALKIEHMIVCPKQFLLIIRELILQATIHLMNIEI